MVSESGAEEGGGEGRGDCPEVSRGVVSVVSVVCPAVKMFQWQPGSEAGRASQPEPPC